MVIFLFPAAVSTELSVFYSQIINYEIHVQEQSFLDQHPFLMFLLP